MKHNDTKLTNAMISSKNLGLLTFSTRHISISLKWIVTSTYLSMIICSTGGSGCTWAVST
jgi:hypothetical protein